MFCFGGLGGDVLEVSESPNHVKINVLEFSEGQNSIEIYVLEILECQNHIKMVGEPKHCKNHIFGVLRGQEHCKNRCFGGLGGPKPSKKSKSWRSRSAKTL